jgi:hypothetical protein
MPETYGDRSAEVRFVNWYVSRLQRAAHTDAVCSVAFHRVANLLDPPANLMKPGIAARVLMANFGRSGREFRDPSRRLGITGMKIRAVSAERTGNRGRRDLVPRPPGG